MALPRELLFLGLGAPLFGLALGTLGQQGARSPGQGTTGTDTASRSTPRTPTARVTAIALTEKDSLRLFASSDTVRVTQFLKNETDGRATVKCVNVVLRDSKASTVVLPGTIDGKSCANNDSATVRLGPWSLTPLTIEIHPGRIAEPHSGHLLIAIHDSSSNRSYSIERPLKLSPRAVRGSPWAEVFVIGGLLLGLVVSALAYAHRRKRAAIGPLKSDPKWNPTASWASNVGVAGGIITALAAVAVPSDQTLILTRPAYTFLAAIFLAITALAPTMYAFLARTESGQTTSSAAVILPSAFTLWGAFGQVLIAAALFLELGHARVLPAGPIWTFLALMSLLFVLLAMYAWRSINALPEPSAERGLESEATTYTML
jgi:hypothetical protein